MNKFYSTNYWSVGFQSRLYDRLSPESYFESMRRVVAVLPDRQSLNLLDAGCGSGLLLQFLAGRIREGMAYTGIDILKTGVAQALLRARELGVADRVSCFQSDLTSSLAGQKFDVVVGHFSLYTLATSEKRQEALANLKSLIKPDGLLILANPSVDYDADSIIEESIQLVRNRHGFLASLIKQTLVYPFTKAIGLRFIQKQLRSGEWKAYTRDEFSQEMTEAGFSVQHIEEVYAGSAFLATARLAP
ncbi:MAG: class I SAM-dependent methyltransferase [Nitrospinae bacterium]|nr:class I SAM-dependent methyltransferase [Nitrospinota bacterium]MBL7019419.1 class I SAM-dependent methyltransferase [Nitrospinaceae bacterium]